MKLAYGVCLFLCFWSDWKPHRILNIYTQDMRLRGSGHRERQWLCSQESLENCDFLVSWEIASRLALPYSFAISLIYILSLFFEPGVSHMTFHTVFSFPILCRSCFFFFPNQIQLLTTWTFLYFCNSRDFSFSPQNTFICFHWDTSSMSSIMIMRFS